jgi:hypothetical protein
MENSSFKALIAKMAQLEESEQGQLKGGFSSYSASGTDLTLGDGTLDPGTGTNNCNCKNKNRGKTCTGCEAAF